MDCADVVSYLAGIRGKAWLCGQEVPEDGRTPTPTQLLSLAVPPAIVGANVLAGDDDNRGHDPLVQALLSKHAVAGGIVCLCWHPPNFFGTSQQIGTAWVADQSAPKPDLTCLLTGKDTARIRYRRAVGRLIAYIRMLPAWAPVIIRPWHEAGGRHFWWGADATDPARSEAGVKQLWLDTVARVRTACPNVLTAWSGAMTWYNPMLYGYPGADSVDLVGASLYSSTVDFAHDNDYTALLSAGQPALLFEFGSASDAAAGWDARKLQAAMNTRYSRLVGVVAWQDNNSWLRMSNSATVLLGARVLSRLKLPVGYSDDERTQ